MELVSSFCVTTTTNSFRFFGFDCLPGCCVKNTWKSSAAAIKEITKGEFFVPHKKQQTIICVKS